MSVSLGSAKPLPSIVYDFTVHFLSGLIFMMGLFSIFDIHCVMLEIIEETGLSETYIDDILYVLVFLALSYAAGHLVSSLSAVVLQTPLDNKLQRPFDRYFSPDVKDKESRDEKFYLLKSFFSIPQRLYLCEPSRLENQYYDKFLIGNKVKEKKALQTQLKKHNLNHLIDAKKNGNDNKTLRTTCFHYLESLSKSNPHHHAEIIYNHLIQYSFARNISFVFSSLLFALVTKLFICWGVAKYVDIRIICNLCYWFDPSSLFQNIYYIAFGIVFTWWLSWLFFVRFLDQYKRYTREIYLTFMTNSDFKEKKSPKKKSSKKITL